MEEESSSLWDIDHETATDRIAARRKRIKNRLEAAKRLTTLIKIGQMFSGSGSLESADPKARVSVSFFVSNNVPYIYTVSVN